MRNFTLILVAMLLSATTLIAQNNEQPTITIKTEKAAGEEIQIGVWTDVENPNIWIDLNNNKIKDPGEAVTSDLFIDDYERFFGVKYTINNKTKTITIYGKVKELTFNDYDSPHTDKSNLSLINAEKNLYLRYLHCSSNKKLKTVILNSTIKSVDLNDNSIESIDVSKATELTNLRLANNELKKLDVSQCPKLESLNIEDNPLLKDLDVRKNTMLKSLYLKNNKENKNIDLSQNTNLESLDATNSELVNIDLSNNTKLKYLNLNYSDNINNIDLSKNLNLKRLWVKYTSIAMLDISPLSKLENIKCGGANLKALNLANGKNATTLKNVEVIGPGLNGKCINVDANFDPNTNNKWKKPTTAFWGNNCGVNTQPYMTLTTSKESGEKIQLKIIPDGKLSNCWIDLNNNGVQDNGEKVTSYNKKYTVNSQTFKIYGKVVEFECKNNSLTNIYTNRNAYLRHLNLYKNNLKTLDISHNAVLKFLDISYNTITNLDVSNNIKLEVLQYPNTNLNLNVSKNINLKELYCYRNNLKNLNLKNNIKLEKLYCSNNNLKTLDLSNNTNLRTLHCSSNELKNLDLSNNTNLKSLYCIKNELTSLIINSNNLETISIADNKLDACALNTIYYSLPNRKKTTVGKIIALLYDNSSNPGLATSNSQAAIDKNWKFYKNGSPLAEISNPGDNTGCLQAAFSISAKKHDFNQVFIGQTATKEFTITNPGTQALNIANVKFSSIYNPSFYSMFSTSLKKNTVITAGQQKTFTVSFSPKKIGTGIVRLEIKTNAPDSPHFIGLTGKGKKGEPQFEISATEYDFGEVKKGKTIKKLFIITNKGNATLKISKITSNNSMFTTTPTNSLNIPAGDKKGILIKYTPTSVGAHSAEISLTDNAGNHLIKVKGKGKIVTEVKEIKSSQVSIYPNPAKGRFFIKTIKAGKVQIMNLLGQLLYSHKLETGVNEIYVEKPGVYILNIINENNLKVTEKIIIK